MRGSRVTVTIELILERARIFGLLAVAGCSFPDYGVGLQAQPSPIGTCRDGLLNADEVDVDCGPSCGAGCSTGTTCATDGECQSGFCNQGACGVPSCTDGAKNRAESDVDCGGSDGCRACTVGERCVSAYDCDGGPCTNGRCQAESCGDGLQNQTETDVDCGGDAGCDRCATKQHCASDTDCDHAHCAQGRCQAAGCEDGLKNGDESDVDCGGSCPTCDAFSMCGKAEDCTSAVCNSYAGICLAATCNDGIKNGTEPTTDCGKDCQNTCSLTAVCHTDADCQSASCSDERCVPAKATGQALPMAGWIATASATFNGDTVPARGIDGNGGTHWTSGASQLPGMWFQLDMLAAKPLFAVDLVCDSNDDYPRSIRVLLSEDGQTFTPATATMAGTKQLRLELGKARVARYVKLELEQDTGGTWWRIDELRVLQ
jgi:hypothetical protein